MREEDSIMQHTLSPPTSHRCSNHLMPGVQGLEKAALQETRSAYYLKDYVHCKHYLV